MRPKSLSDFSGACSLKISPLTYRFKRLICLSAVVPFYGDKAVCAPVTFEIMRGDRIALEGNNGSGKSSILKLLCGQPIEYCGTIERGSGITVSRVPQDTSHLRGTLADFAVSHHTDESLFKAILHKMGFDRQQFGKDISDFSDGQKKNFNCNESLSASAFVCLGRTVEFYRHLFPYSNRKTAQRISAYNDFCRTR